MTNEETKRAELEAAIPGLIAGRETLRRRLNLPNLERKSKMAKQTFDQATLDQAREWVGENYPGADGEEWEALVEEAAAEIVEIHADADASEAYYRKG